MARLDYGCKRGPGVTDPGLFFCTAHLSYGYEREGRCHNVNELPPYQSTLTVRVSLRVTVDVDDYRAEYGRESTDEIRTAVRSAITDAARHALASGIESVEEAAR